MRVSLFNGHFTKVNNFSFTSLCLWTNQPYSTVGTLCAFMSAFEFVAGECRFWTSATLAATFLFLRLLCTLWTGDRGFLKLFCKCQILLDERLDSLSSQWSLLSDSLRPRRNNKGGQPSGKREWEFGIVGSLVWNRPSRTVVCWASTKTPPLFGGMSRRCSPLLLCDWGVFQESVKCRECLEFLLQKSRELKNTFK